MYVKSSGSSSQDPLTADALIQKNLGISLLGYELDNVKLSDSNIYTFVYVKPFTNVAYQVEFNMNNMGYPLGNYLIVKTGSIGYY